MHYETFFVLTLGLWFGQRNTRKFVVALLLKRRMFRCADPHLFLDVLAAILERKKAAHRLYVDEAVNDDNSVVALNPNTMETLQLFRGDTVLLKARHHVSANSRRCVIVACAIAVLTWPVTAFLLLFCLSCAVHPVLHNVFLANAGCALLCCTAYHSPL